MFNVLNSFVLIISVGLPEQNTIGDRNKRQQSPDCQVIAMRVIINNSDGLIEAFKMKLFLIFSIFRKFEPLD